MGTSKHTTERWVYGQDWAQRKTGSAHWSIGLDRDPLDPAGVTGCSPDRESDDYMLMTGICGEDRARLIAAAPELLYAAKIGLEVAEKWIRDQLDGTSELDDALSALAPVRAALAKAEGA